jgi:hypothetical protein
MSDKIIYRRPISDVLSVTGTQDSARGVLSSIYEAIVADVILDHTHPEYSRVDGFNVGSIRVRILNYTQNLSESLLPWADPIDMSVQEYPLIGEMVSLTKIRGNFFYSKKIPIARRIQENAFLKLNDALSERSSNTLSNAIRQETEAVVKKHKFGGYYRPDSRVRPLKHFEGDTIFQGRMGQSMRFGSSKIDPSSESLAPNIILRAGQGKDLEKERVSIDTVFGVMLEDINKDPSSIWMVSDQVVPLEPSTINAGSFVRSLKSPPQIFDKAQIIINSDRILLNTKTNSIMLFSADSINLNSFNDITADTDGNILFTANQEMSVRVNKSVTLTADENIVNTAGNSLLFSSQEKASIVSKKIFIGSVESEEEPMVGGASLAEAIKTLIKIFTDQPILVTTPSGPGRISPLVKQQLNDFIDNVLKEGTDATFNSKSNFVSLENEEVEIEKNEFEDGKVNPTEPNEWILTNQYYRVL